MRTKWWSRRAIGLHATVVIVAPGFLALGWWQLHRALSGNGLSWAYTFEWPLFTIYAVYLWWRLVHEMPEDSAPPVRRHWRDPDAQARKAAEEAAQLAAYNAYLASLGDEHVRHES